MLLGCPFVNSYVLTYHLKSAGAVVTARTKAAEAVVGSEMWNLLAPALPCRLGPSQLVDCPEIKAA